MRWTHYARCSPNASRPSRSSGSSLRPPARDYRVHKVERSSRRRRSSCVSRRSLIRYAWNWALLRVNLKILKYVWVNWLHRILYSYGHTIVHLYSKEHSNMCSLNSCSSRQRSLRTHQCTLSALQSSRKSWKNNANSSRSTISSSQVFEHKSLPAQLWFDYRCYSNNRKNKFLMAAFYWRVPLIILTGCNWVADCWYRTRILKHKQQRWNHWYRWIDGQIRSVLVELSQLFLWAHKRGHYVWLRNTEERIALDVRLRKLQRQFVLSW